MVRTRSAAAREISEPGGRVTKDRAPRTRATRARKNSEPGDTVLKGRERRTRLRRTKESSRLRNRVVKDPAPSPQKKTRNLQSSQQDHRHSSTKEHRKCCPEDFPDLDFHQSWGSFLTRKNPISKAMDPEVSRYWDMLNTTPTLLQHYTDDIAGRYFAAFRQFFTVDPISVHGHVSDAGNPFVLASLLIHLTAYFPEDCGFSFISEDDKEASRIAVTHDSYGAGHGPLAYTSAAHSFRSVGCGARPVVVNTSKPAKIDRQVRLAKAQGCVALIAEIVRAGDGTVVSEAAWKALLESCKRHCLVLVVDEALTAIRCGAPFAHQLPQYRKHGFPDLILFGKAIRTNGIAIEWQGVNIHKMAITDEDQRLKIISLWQERYTEMAPVADLLTSVGTLVLAEREDWPQRAQKIGEVLRDIIKGGKFTKASAIGGLHSLIYLRQEDYAQTTSPVMGAYANKYMRWLPVMDEVTMSKDELLVKVFGKDSLVHRQQVAEWFESIDLQPNWCGMCGGAVRDGRRRLCPRCVVNQCVDCEPGVHVCPMEDLDE